MRETARAFPVSSTRTRISFSTTIRRSATMISTDS